MENASKALIIAGAILLSILIIALGVYIFNMAKGSIGGNSLDSVEISTFNDPITQYEGTTLGSSVKSLLSYLSTSAADNKDAADRLPDIYYYDNGAGPDCKSASYTSTSDSEVVAPTTPTSSESGKSYTLNCTIYSTVADNAVKYINLLKNKISNTHNYTVSFEMNSEGLVNNVIICY